MAGQELGLVGVGLLGTALAERFLAKGFHVSGFDPDLGALRRLADLGGRPARSAAEVFRACNRVVLCLPSNPQVEAVLAEADGELRPGQTVVDTTTGDPDRSAALGMRLAARCVRYLDASIVGSSAQARGGMVLVLAGGEPSAFAGCADLFACFAREWSYLGPCGSGQRMKLVVNLVMGLNRAALAEGLAFASACGLDAAEALRVLKAGPSYSRVMDVKGRKMIEHDFRPEARLAQHLKDVRLILAAAEQAVIRLPLSATHRGLLEQVVELGGGEEDNSAVLRAYEPSRAREASAP